MTMTLKVVVPPHPLIAHWLTILRHANTPPAIYSTALEEIGKWLTYEAVRDWLPHRQEEVDTPNSRTQGTVIEPSVPLIALPELPGGLDLWQGGKQVLPNSHLCIGGVPKEIESNAGIIVYMVQITTGNNLLNTLKLLSKLKVEPKRIRVISTLASKPGLVKVGESTPDLTIYTACIDPELTLTGEINPGIGNPSSRLNTRSPYAH